MTSIDIKKEFGSDFRDIWKNLKTNDKFLLELKARNFLLAAALPKGPHLLFLGLNPSFTSGSNGQERNGNYFRLQQSGNDYPRYWRAFEDMAKNIGEKKPVSWSHLDLLAIRHTKAKDILPYFDTPFIQGQIQIFRRILTEIHPQFIIVTNTKVRDWFWNSSSFSIEERQGKGAHAIFYDSWSCPIFFTGMLSGQRALDIESRERLVWHIKNYDRITV